MKVIILSPKNRTIYNFRGDLIKDIVSLGHEVIATGPNTIDEDKITALGAKFVEIPLRKNGLNPFEDIRYLYRLIKLMKQEKPQVSFGYTIKPVIYGAVAARICKVNHVVSMVTGAGYLFSANSVKAKILSVFGSVLYKIGFSCAKKVIFQNPDDCDAFVQMRLLSAAKTKVVNGSGVNMAYFSSVSLPKKLTFFMLSRIMKSKGVNEYLLAAKAVKQRYPDVQFVLLGAFEDIQDSIKREDIQPYIDADIIAYYGETSDVRKYYEKCSVYVLPSYREGTPRTVLEAMAMKRPIITTDVPGCRETVVNGENGFLVPAYDSVELAEKMEWFIKHPDKIAEMGEASYKICQKKFDVKKVNKAMLEILSID